MVTTMTIMAGTFESTATDAAMVMIGTMAMEVMVAMDVEVMEVVVMDVVGMDVVTTEAMGLDETAMVLMDPMVAMTTKDIIKGKSINFLQ